MRVTKDKSSPLLIVLNPWPLKSNDITLNFFAIKAKGANDSPECPAP